MNKIILLLLCSVIALKGFAQPVITSVSPTKAPISAAVTINGSGFSTSPGNNYVYFGAVKAIVNSSTATTLNVIVPAGASFAPVSVTTGNLTAYSLQSFDVVFPGGGAAFSTSTYLARVDYLSGTDPRGLSIMDFDGDNLPDLAVTNFGSHSLSIFKNASAGGGISLASRVDLSTGLDPYGLSTGDIDGDGKQDLVVTNASSASLSVFRNNSTPGNISFEPKVDLPLGNNSPNTVAITDLDRDGRPDLVVETTAPLNRVSVFRNTTTSGIISFGPEISYAAPIYSFGIALGDVDGDSKPDIAISDPHANSFSVYRNTSTTGVISFAARVDFASPNNPYSIALADLENDGKPDVVVGNSTSESISAYRNTSVPGTVSFAPAVIFLTALNPINVIVSDMNADGMPDLAVANVNDHSVSLLRNTSTVGSISFASSVYIATPINPRAWVNDLNADGKPDLITTNAGSSSISIYQSLIALPTSLLRFSGYRDGNKNSIEWITVSEENTDYFELQRSIDGIQYSPVVVKQAAGNNSSEAFYSYDDITGINSPIYYYRLKMVDKDGHFRYSSVIVINVAGRGFVVEASPNPFQGQLKVNIEIQRGDRVSLILIDLNGKTVMQRSYLLNQGSHSIGLNGLNKLASGIYLLQVFTSELSQTVRIVKN